MIGRPSKKRGWDTRVVRGGKTQVSAHAPIATVGNEALNLLGDGRRVRDTHRVTTPFADKPTLAGDLVTLRPIHAHDANAIDRLIREDDEIVRLTGSIPSSTEGAQGMPMEELREIYGAWARATDRLVLGVIDSASGDLVGEAVLNDWDEGNRFYGFRTLIGAVGRGRGLGTEATRLIIQNGLGSMGLHRITLEVYDFNPRARHAHHRIGFVHEGAGR